MMGAVSLVKSREEYYKLRKKYDELKRKYEYITSAYVNPVVMKVRTKLPQELVLLSLILLGSYGYSVYRNNAAIYLGLFAAAAAMAHELYGTKVGWWKYYKSVYMIAGRVPLGIPLTYFFMGMVVVAYMLFRGA